MQTNSSTVVPHKHILSSLVEAVSLSPNLLCDSKRIERHQKQGARYL